jgi:hypothetical protein
MFGRWNSKGFGILGQFPIRSAGLPSSGLIIRAVSWLGAPIIEVTIHRSSGIVLGRVKIETPSGRAVLVADGMLVRAGRDVSGIETAAWDVAEAVDEVADETAAGEELGEEFSELPSTAPDVVNAIDEVEDVTAEGGEGGDRFIELPFAVPDAVKLVDGIAERLAAGIEVNAEIGKSPLADEVSEASGRGAFVDVAAAVAPGSVAEDDDPEERPSVRGWLEACPLIEDTVEATSCELGAAAPKEIGKEPAATELVP